MGNLIIQQKKAIRKQVKSDFFKYLPEIDQKNKKIEINIKKLLKKFKNIKKVLIYFEKYDEFPISSILKLLPKSVELFSSFKSEETNEWLIARVNKNSRKCIKEKKFQSLKKAGFGSDDIVFVPGRAFSKNCERIGRGGGVYDRFLVGCKSIKIGVCYGFQVFDNLVQDKFDQKVDFVVTEEKVYGLNVFSSSTSFPSDARKIAAFK